jgi:cysteinyl-tRNA synthetase
MHEKMSKSLNNFFTIRGVLENYDGETLRYFIMSQTVVRLIGLMSIETSLFMV